MDDHVALGILRECATPAGFVAARSRRSNYGRVWARDASICGLAALSSGDPALIDTLEASLLTLVRHQGRAGQIPSNVDGRQGQGPAAASYGGNAGRVDATLWFMVAAGLLGRLANRDALVERLWPQLLRARAVLVAWEFNTGDLVYVPMAGDWADEYVHHGYVLYDQVLRIWGLRELAAAANRLDLPERDGLDADAERIHRRVSEAYRGPEFFCAAFHPGGRTTRFDAFGNALCCLLDIGPIATREAAIAHAAAITRFDLVPAFDPPILPGEPEYAQLEFAATEHLRNTPGRYHNGGLWPMVNGFWALAAAHMGRDAFAERLTKGIHQANRRGDNGFYEYLDADTGEPGGVRHQAWSAAGEVLAQARTIDWATPPNGAV